MFEDNWNKNLQHKMDILSRIVPNTNFALTSVVSLVHHVGIFECRDLGRGGLGGGEASNVMNIP
jgi:hypothetical protein